ncbi:MAG: hypothetical protein V4568_17425 [Pseudomonadota bacterium]
MNNNPTDVTKTEEDVLEEKLAAALRNRQEQFKNGNLSLTAWHNDWSKRKADIEWEMNLLHDISRLDEAVKKEENKKPNQDLEETPEEKANNINLLHLMSTELSALNSAIQELHKNWKENKLSGNALEMEKNITTWFSSEWSGDRTDQKWLPTINDWQKHYNAPNDKRERTPEQERIYLEGIVLELKQRLEKQHLLRSARENDIYRQQWRLQALETGAPLDEVTEKDVLETELQDSMRKLIERESRDNGSLSEERRKQLEIEQRGIQLQKARMDLQTTYKGRYSHNGSLEPATVWLLEGELVEAERKLFKLISQKPLRSQEDGLHQAVDLSALHPKTAHWLQDRLDRLQEKQKKRTREINSAWIRFSSDLLTPQSSATAGNQSTPRELGRLTAELYQCEAWALEHLSEKLNLFSKIGNAAQPVAELSATKESPPEVLAQLSQQLDLCRKQRTAQIGKIDEIQTKMVENDKLIARGKLDPQSFANVAAYKKHELTSHENRLREIWLHFEDLQQKSDIAPLVAEGLREVTENVRANWGEVMTKLVPLVQEEKEEARKILEKISHNRTEVEKELGDLENKLNTAPHSEQDLETTIQQRQQYLAQLNSSGYQAKKNLYGLERELQRLEAGPTLAENNLIAKRAEAISGNRQKQLVLWAEFDAEENKSLQQPAGDIDSMEKRFQILQQIGNKRGALFREYESLPNEIKFAKSQQSRLEEALKNVHVHELRHRLMLTDLKHAKNESRILQESLQTLTDLLPKLAKDIERTLSALEKFIGQSEMQIDIKLKQKKQEAPSNKFLGFLRTDPLSEKYEKCISLNKEMSAEKVVLDSELQVIRPEVARLEEILKKFLQDEIKKAKFPGSSLVVEPWNPQSSSRPNFRADYLCERGGVVYAVLQRANNKEQQIIMGIDKQSIENHMQINKYNSGELKDRPVINVANHQAAVNSPQVRRSSSRTRK